MPIVSDFLAERILTKDIDKQEALRSFENLSESEKKQLMSKLMTNLSGNEKDLLRAVDQRDLNSRHKEYIEKITKKYREFVPKSKELILEYQDSFVDQRRPFHLIKDLKRIHFQITYKKAEGPYVYDIDGNKYIDISGDMGVNIFGHKPKFIIDSVQEGLDRGIPLVGYSETLFETTKLFSEITGHERVLFTQSGTEAVMFAVRIARAATSKKKIVIFDGAYHGLSDAVTAMQDQGGRSAAAGPGMLKEFADQLIILNYGKMHDIDIIESESDNIAGVLIEPVQSRHPHIQPIEFLHELRNLTLEKGIPLIFDEMITGFRVCPKGAQGYFNIKADIATYGKIPGGGLPTGIIAGSAKYMDLIDGGTWNFDDDSMPKQKRTGVAGTHTQNPLKISSAFAVLSEISKRCSVNQTCDDCSCFQKELNKKTKSLAEEVNAFFGEKRLPIVIDYFGSLFRFRFIDSYWGITEALFFILLRMNGIETNIQGNCFLTTAHSDEDLRKIVSSVKKSADTLLKEGFFCKSEIETNSYQKLKVEDIVKSPEQVHGKLSEKRLDKHQIEKLKNLIRADLHNFQNLGS